MKKFILFIIFLYNSNIIYSQNNFVYETISYVCHDKNIYGNWSNERYGKTDLIINIGYKEEIIEISGSSTYFKYYITGEFVEEKYPKTYIVYKCYGYGMDFIITLTVNAYDNSKFITLENLQTRVTYSVKYLTTY